MQGVNAIDGASGRENFSTKPRLLDRICEKGALLKPRLHVLHYRKELAAQKAKPNDCGGHARPSAMDWRWENVRWAVGETKKWIERKYNRWYRVLKYRKRGLDIEAKVKNGVERIKQLNIPKRVAEASAKIFEAVQHAANLSKYTRHANSRV